MRIQKWFNGPKLWFILPVLLAAACVVAGCSTADSPSAAAAPAPTLVCPTAAAPTPVSFDDLWKSSPHAAAQAAAFTHWDNTSPQQIPVTCAKCHSRPGFLDFLGVDGTAAGTVENPAVIGTTITCFVCHNDASSNLDSVTFPSGKRITGLGPVSLCVSCHEGRASTQTVDDAIAKVAAPSDDTPSANLAFVDSHSISGATSFGTEAQGAYEYAGKTYQGRFTRGGNFFTCIQCHDQHTLKVKVEYCTECHTFAADVKNIRVNTTDYAGDGNTQEGVAFEVQHMHDDLLVAIQAYAKKTAGVPLVYDQKTYPYFFIDTNGNGKADPAEITAANKYNAWTPRLLRAAYNYIYVASDPGAFAHNNTYVFQVMYDSIADLGGNVSGMTRP
ncbi:MAG TPA: hypothetical protein VLZ89_04860 [Anaerolineales bacterium]|nr:hypothetical protein [Anaerolineales bacterium]